jgi:hypothetical protein
MSTKSAPAVAVTVTTPIRSGCETAGSRFWIDTAAE